MTGPDGHTADREGAARRRGRSEGLATAALAVGAVAFLNLLGVEKGILAIVLAVLSLRNAPAGPPPRRAQMIRTAPPVNFFRQTPPGTVVVGHCADFAACLARVSDRQHDLTDVRTRFH